MSNFSDFHNISAQFDKLIRENVHTEMRIPLSKKHRVFMSIARIGLFRTGGIDVELVSISKFGALFNTTHHALLKSQGKDMTVELSLNGKYFEYEAHVVQLDSINNLYGVKFSNLLEAIDDYLAEFHLHPHHNEDILKDGSVWLHLAKA